MEPIGIYKRTLKTQVKEWNTLITLLAEKVENAGHDVQHKYVQDLAEIRRKQGDAIKMIGEVEASNCDTWENVKASTDRSYHKLGTVVVQAMATFE